MVSDEFLLHRYAGSRDVDAFRELVRRYAGLVYGTCLRIADNADQAADVAQECFIELARSAGAVRSSLPAWLHRVARNRSLNAIRDESTRRRYEAQAAGEAIPDSEPQWRDIALCLDEAIDALPEQLRVPIILHYFQGLSHSEVASRLGLERSSVSRRLDKGLDALREQLKSAGIVAPAAVLAGLIVSNQASAAPDALVSELNSLPLTNAGAGTGLAAFLGTVAGKVAAVLVAVSVIGGGLAVTSGLVHRGGFAMDPKQIPGVALALGDGEHTAKMAVEDLPAIPSAGRDRFFGCLHDVLSARGVEVEHDELMGLSGAAFRVHFWLEDWCPDSTNYMGGFEHPAPVLQALGFDYKLYHTQNTPLGSAARADTTWREAMIQSLDAGWPAIGEDIDGSGRYAVIVGYVDGGKRWIGRPFDDTSGSYTLSTQDPPFNILVIGRRTKPMEPRAALRRSLEIALELANTKSYYRGGPQASGFAAYDAWTAALGGLNLSGNGPGEGKADANHAIYTALTQARSAAAWYLAKHAAELGPGAKPHMLKAAELYRQIAAKLEAGSDNLPAFLGADPDGTKHYDIANWTAKMRQTEAEVLTQVVSLEREAVHEIELSLRASP